MKSDTKLVIDLSQVIEFFGLNKSHVQIDHLAKIAYWAIKHCKAKIAEKRYWVNIDCYTLKGDKAKIGHQAKLG